MGISWKSWRTDQGGESVKAICAIE